MIKSHVISSLVFLFLFAIQKGNSQENGVASYYADFFEGRRMANGDRYDPDQLTCAHQTAPIGSLIKVVRKDNPDFSVIVTVSDRGPFIKGRIIDLSKKAAKELGILHLGIAEVVVAIVKNPSLNKAGYFALSDSQD